jgi:ABC-type branched-subunit amino acid transport system ATPase component/predicted MFS family arabinose efflux permease
VHSEKNGRIIPSSFDQLSDRWPGSSGVGAPLSDASSATPTKQTGGENPANLARIVSEGAQERHRADAAADEVLLPEDLLPGTREESVSLLDGLRKTGTTTFAVLAVIVALDNLQSSGLSVLAPNIQSSFHVSSGVIVFVAGISGAFLVLGILPMGWLADHFRRAPIIGIATFFFGAMVFVSGLATNIFLFFLARFGAGVSQASTQTVHGSLLADTYPISLRGRIYAAMGVAIGIATAVSPILAGSIASAVGGSNGWRWAFYVLAVPILLVSVIAFRLREPPRGQFEKLDVLGDVVEDSQPVPPSLEAAFARIMKIRTMKMCLIAFSAMGFGLFTAPVLGNLFLKQEYGLDAFRRGLIGTIGSLGVLVALPFVGRYYDRLYRRDPSQALALIGKLILPVAVLVPVQYFMPNAILWALFSVLVTVLTLSAFSMVGPVLTSVAPYHLRGLTGAVGAIYLFFFGATGGAVLSAGLDQAFGPRTAVLIVMIPTTLVGAYMIIRGSRFIRNDLSLIVVELQEEMEEHRRQAEDPDSIPVLHLNNVDFSYGHVQVLFGVGFEVRRGEILALLGTNGAGKSTALRVAAGLVTSDRGVVRLNGRAVTYATPEQRSRLGIHLLPGGRGVFGEMTVLENLEMGGFAYRSDRDELRRRVERVLALFPVLDEAKRRRADTLSGGQQQMLALSIALLHDPEVLMIDELSLGLAPIVVQELIEVVERLKREGVTMIIVEQSLNVAAAIADRAVFMEKGQVRFEGAISDLIERDDLARAVFLGGEVPA